MSGGRTAQYSSFERLLPVLHDWNGTDGAPGDGWKLFPFSSNMTLRFARKKLAPKIKPYGRS